MSSGFVTVAPTSRGTRSSRRRRNKTTNSSASTTIPQQSSSSSIIKSNQQSPSNPLPSNHVQTASSSLQSNQGQLENKNIKSTSPQSAPSNDAIQSETKPSSIWDRRKQVRTQNKSKNPAKPVARNTNKKHIVQSAKITNKSASKADAITRGGSGGLSSQSRGFRSRRVAHSYNADSVDMNRKLPQRQIETEKESFPSLQQANTKKAKVKEGSLLSSSSGYKPKRTAVQYNPDSVDMTRKPPPSDTIRSPSSDTIRSAPKARSGGLSARSKGFRVSTVPVSSVTFGRGARRYIPPRIRGLSDTDRTKIMGTKNIDKSTQKMKKEEIVRPKPVEKEKEKEKEIVRPKRVEKEKEKEFVRPKQSVKQRESISPPKCSGSPSRPSRSSKKKVTSPLQSKDTKKYLEMRAKGRICDVFLIKRDNKNVHDVASIKTELTKKIAANGHDDSASNEYYYNKDDMLDFVQNADFNAMNDTSVQVTHFKDERLKSTVEAYNPYIHDQYDDMIPMHTQGQYMEPFPGMIPNVPLITDQNEIAFNAEIAKGSKLRAVVDDFVPEPPPINQFQANNILQFNRNAAVPNQQWVIINND